MYFYFQDDPAESSTRLRRAREAAGYQTAADAAAAMGVKSPTYTHHENGTSGYSRHAARYARFFRVSLDWLMSGKGEMHARPSTLFIPVTGVVGAGAMVTIEAEAEILDKVQAEIPLDDGICALRVEGLSMYPRFLPGEFILYRKTPVDPETLIGGLAVVQLHDTGEMLIKILQRSGPATWTLESHNAPPMRAVTLLAAWCVIGALFPTAKDAQSQTD